MNWRNDNTFSDTLGISKDPKPLELSPNTLHMNEIDKDIYYDCVDRYETMAENLNNGLQQYAPFDYLSEDIFNSLFKYNAKIREEDEIKSFSRFNHSIMDNLMQSEDYEKLRKSTKFDLMGSAIGTEVMQQKAMERINFYKEQYRLQQQTGQQQEGADIGELIEQLNGMKQTQDAIDNLSSGLGTDGQGLTTQEASQLAALQRQLQQQQQAIDDMQDVMEQFTNDITETLDDASKQAKSDIDEVRDIVQSWGLESRQNNKKISLEKRKKAIERIRRSPRLKQLTDLIGRMRSLAMQSKKQKVPDGHSIQTVETGNYLPNIIPTELARLANPTMKKDFKMRYNQKQLLQYKKEDIRSTGRGPVIVCHDKSWSMEGNKDDWSTALCLAVLEVAQKDKRNYAYIPYDSKVCDRMVKDIPCGSLDPDDILDIAEFDTQGGTDFMTPLDRAVEFIKESNYKKADILFITDGECGVDTQWLADFKKIKQDKQFFVSTVLINTDGGASKATVELFSDSITTLSSLAELDEANAKEIFKLVEDAEKFEPQDELDDIQNP